MTYYEVLPEIEEEHDSNVTILASFTERNGIRLMLQDERDWCLFTFNPDQAELVGQALIRWAQRLRRTT